MEYDTLKNKIDRRVSGITSDLARCHDIYRLNQLLRILSEDMSTYHCIAQQMVDELEE